LETLMGNICWDVATSDFSLTIDGLVLLAALAVGFVPFGKYMPVIGPYVPVARLIALLVALLIVFLIGFRVADERQEKRTLRAIVAAQTADVETSAKAASDAESRANTIEKEANDRRKADDDYIASLKPVDGACGFDPDGGRLPNHARPAAARAKSPAGRR
jgi:hypothetical protein